MDLAPIVLFVYNRPEHTLQTLTALKANTLADQSVLYIYADGPKSKANDYELDEIRKTREAIRKDQWCKEVNILESHYNKGLADSIVEGVTKVVNDHGKVIVLEDDIVTSPGFLQYMNDALHLYEHEDQVMHVSGYMFPVKKELPETFFYNTASCWGWGTWKRAWQYFTPDAKLLVNRLVSEDKIIAFDIEHTYPFFKSLTLNVEGKLKTWAVKWYASFFLQGGYALHPFPSLVNNIGNDGSGINSGTTDIFFWEELAAHIHVKKTPVVESEQARKAMRKYYKTYFQKRKKKFKGLKRTISSFLPQKFRHNIKRMLDSNYREEYDERQRLSDLPRYVKTTTQLLGKKIQIADAASFLFMFKEIFQQEVYKFYASSPDPRIIDCGANIGLSLIYFKKLFPQAKIIGFEPDEEIFGMLRNNMDVFGLNDVELIKKGVWSKETTLQFFAEGADGGRIAAAGDNDDGAQIQTIRLRKYLNAPVDFLKIDIEGAETEVIKDCEDLLHQVQYMFIEYHSFTRKQQTLDEILSILKRVGFRYSISTPGLRSQNPFIKVNESLGMDMQLNIYCFRS